LIESYSFGNITIDGKTYTADLIIYPDRIEDNWWRKSGHLLQKEDIKDIILRNPDILIIGTGVDGYLKISDEIKRYIKSKGIELIAEKTKKASKIYNELKGKKKLLRRFILHVK